MSEEAQDPRLAWMEINTFECPHGMGRLSPEACAELRSRPDISQATGAPHPSKPGKDYRPKVCASCNKYQALWDEVARKRAAENGQEQTRKDGGMKTLIDCLKCDAQDVPNLGLGLCSSCYHRILPKERRKYSLDAAKKKRMKRLNKEKSSKAGEPIKAPAEGILSLDPERHGKRLEVQSCELEGKRLKVQSCELEPDSEAEALSSGGDDPLAGFEFVPCTNARQRSMEVHVDNPGKFLRFGAKIAQDLGLVSGSHVHLYKGGKGLALKLLPEADRTSYRLSRDGSAQKGHQSKVVLSARRLVKDGIVFPGQRFEARRHETEPIIFLDAIEESSPA